MILLLVGAAERAARTIRDAATPHSLDIRVGTSSETPDWVIASSGSERAEAIRRYRLPSYRVIEFSDFESVEGPGRDSLRVALARMTEIGSLPRPSPEASNALARHAIPLLTEWAAWLAVDEARQKIANRISADAPRHSAQPRGRMLFVVPDVSAFTLLSGLLWRLSREMHEVHVAVTRGSANDPDLSSVQSVFPGLTVGHAPDLRNSPWRPLARALRESLHAWRRLFRSIGGVQDFDSALRDASPLAARLARSRLLRIWPSRVVAPRMVMWIERAVPPDIDLVTFLEDRKPDVLIVVPHRSVQSIEPDYLRIARRLGIHSVCLPLKWDDLRSDDALGYEAPEIFALWSEEERRRLVSDFGVSADRIRVTGALLASDTLDVEQRQPVGRAEYCERMGIDPARRIILVDAPDVSERASIDRFDRWRTLVRESADPQVRGVAVVVYVKNPDEVNAWRRRASTGELFVARAGIGERRALVRITDSVTAADVVMATDLSLVLEAGARAKPVIVLLETERDRDSEIARFCGAYAPGSGWPVVARSVQEAVAQLATLIGSEMTAPALAHPTALRVDGHDSGTDRVYRVLESLVGHPRTDDAPARPPYWKRVLILCCASLARRATARDRGPAARQTPR